MNLLMSESLTIDTTFDRAIPWVVDLGAHLDSIELDDETATPFGQRPRTSRPPGTSCGCRRCARRSSTTPEASVTRAACSLTRPLAPACRIAHHRPEASRSDWAISV